MTKKEILHHIDKTPLMASIRASTLEQVIKMREDLDVQIIERKQATRRSLFWHFIFVLIACSIYLLLFPATSLSQLLLTHILSQVICAVFWFLVPAGRFRKAKRLEYVLTTVLDAAIQEKQAQPIPAIMQT